MADSRDRFPLGAQLTQADLEGDPYPHFHRLRASEPVTWVPAIEQWIVTSRDLVMAVLRDPEHFRTDGEQSPIRRTFGAQMLSTEGDQQRRYKSACAPPFNARAAEDARPLIEQIVGSRVAALRMSATVEVRREYAAPIALEVVARVIGLDPAHDGMLREWYDTFADALMNYAGAPATRARALGAVQAFRASITPILRAPSPNEHSLLVQLARVHPRLLDDEEIGSNALIVLFGGIETTEAMIANALWAMLSHPSTLARARSSTADLMACVEESLRWDAAVQTATRYAAAGATVNGVAIPEGELVQCMLGAANRDPAHYVDPDRFDPWRPATVPHLAFAFGRHFCLGAAVARVEAEVALSQLLATWPEMTRDDTLSTPPRGHEFRKPPALVIRRSVA